MEIHGETQPHFVLLPFMAQGHLIPMADIARLLAKRGVIVSILLTPNNANRVKGAIDRAIGSGLAIRVSHLELPCAQVGLPEGLDNIDLLPSVSDSFAFYKATAMLRDQVEELLQEMKPWPSCLVADMSFPWATDMALKLNIPRLMFHGPGCFPLLCMHLETSMEFEAVASDTEYFVLPDMPDRIEITKAQLRGDANEVHPEWAKMRREMLESEKGSFGTVANTFQELEPEYVERYTKVKGKRVWCVGPVSLCNQESSDMAERGNKASIDKHQCLKWLDSHESGSVTYACLGSLTRLTGSHMVELGLGLEASNRAFIWVIRNASDEFKTWLSKEDFEGRIKGRGLLIQGWAPQVLILSHPSVGAFLTHCGWNSTLEGVTAGLPMITWPMFGEQFCNEKFIVNVIKTGIRIGVEVPVMLGQEDDSEVQVKSEDVKMAIDRLMDGGDEGEERRSRAKKLGETAKTAVEEGGSSYNNMTHLIQEVMMHQVKNSEKSAYVTK